MCLKLIVFISSKQVSSKMELNTQNAGTVKIQNIYIFLMQKTSGISANFKMKYVQYSS